MAPSLSGGILDVETFAAVKAKLAQRATDYKSGGRSGTTAHLLAGLVWCGREGCGTRMSIAARRNPDGTLGTRSWILCLKQNGGCGATRSLSLVTGFVENLVEQVLVDLPNVTVNGPDDKAQAFADMEAERTDSRATSTSCARP